jgi:hypothetical protein
MHLVVVVCATWQQNVKDSTKNVVYRAWANTSVRDTLNTNYQ